MQLQRSTLEYRTQQSTLEYRTQQSTLEYRTEYFASRVCVAVRSGVPRSVGLAADAVGLTTVGHGELAVWPCSAWAG